MQNQDNDIKTKIERIVGQAETTEKMVDMLSTLYTEEIAKARKEVLSNWEKLFDDGHEYIVWRVGNKLNIADKSKLQVPSGTFTFLPQQTKGDNNE